MFAKASSVRHFPYWLDTQVRNALAVPETNALVLRWAREGNVRLNWGDKLNPELVHFLSGRPVYHECDVPLLNGRTVELVIGSMLGTAQAHERAWGPGFLTRTGRMRHTPRAIHAVRGPLSRAKVLEAGHPCPEIYGDPALLVPLMYCPTVPKTHRIGVIQHFREFGEIGPPVEARSEDVKTIDICGSVYQVIEDILSCDMILSSSLHGLIAAHAYGRPAGWLKFSDLPRGDDFKFHDYFASVGAPNCAPIRVQPGANYDELILDLVELEPLVDLAALVEACPFVDEERKRFLKAGAGALHPSGFRPVIARRMLAS